MKGCQKITNCIVVGGLPCYETACYSAERKEKKKQKTSDRIE